MSDDEPHLPYRNQAIVLLLNAQDRRTRICNRAYRELRNHVVSIINDARETYAHSSICLDIPTTLQNVGVSDMGVHDCEHPRIIDNLLGFLNERGYYNDRPTEGALRIYWGPKGENPWDEDNEDD